MTCCFVISIFRKRNDIADTAWGIGFFIASLVPIFLHQTTETITLQQLVTTGLVLIWGSRLSLHIHTRNKNKGEDPRYLAWRQSWNWFYTRSFFQIYMLQGLLLILVVSPVLFINTYPVENITNFFIIGLLIWIIGFSFESIGDSQLKAFIKNPDNRGKIMDKGLWAYSRHPNYFGEVTQWWGLFIIAFQVQSGLYSIIGPLTITILIVFVSGIPMLERSFVGRPGFEEYKKKTSVFIPWFRG